MPLKGIETCGPGEVLVMAAAFKKVFSISSVRSAAGQASGADLVYSIEK